VENGKLYSNFVKHLLPNIIINLAEASSIDIFAINSSEVSLNLFGKPV